MRTCAVVIATLNEADHIGNLLRTLSEDRYPHKRVIVVDGGSTDGTAEIAENHGAVVLEERGETKSLPGARNQGAEHAISEYDADVLCFLDGDLRLSPNFVSHGMKHFNDEEDVIAVRTIANGVRDSLLMKVYSPIEEMADLADDGENAPPPPPAHFYSREAFEAVEGFEILGFREDWTFYNKVRDYAESRGKRILLEEKCVRYGHLDSLAEFYHQQEWYGRTFVPYVEYAGRRKGAVDLFLLKPLVFSISFFALLAYAGSRWPPLLVLGLPFLLKGPLLVYESVRYRSLYVFPHLLLNALGNVAFIVGLIKYLVGDERLTRGVD